MSSPSTKEPAITLDHEPTCKWPRLDEADEAAVSSVLRDGDVSTHPVIRELEQDYASYAGRAHALAHSSGTSGLMAAFFALDLEPGDEVLVPTATFWASVLPMLWCGLVPVFCESEPDRLGPCADDMRMRITPRTKALVVVHLWGLPAKMTEILALADEFGLKVIEDASHAHGARWRGRRCGKLGDVSVLSLQGDKLAPAGEGGMLLTDDAAIHERAVCLGDITRIIELDTPARRFAATSFGIKTRIAPMSAALGRSQLARLDENNARRAKNHLRICEALEGLGYETFLAPAHVDRVWFEFIVRHRDRKFDVAGVARRLQDEGARVAAPRYPLLHEQPFFTEGHWREVSRVAKSEPSSAAPRPPLRTTGVENARLLRLLNFPGEDNGIVDQYIEAFRRAI